MLRDTVFTAGASRKLRYAVLGVLFAEELLERSLAGAAIRPTCYSMSATGKIRVALFFHGRSFALRDDQAKPVLLLLDATRL